MPEVATSTTVEPPAGTALVRDRLLAALRQDCRRFQVHNSDWLRSPKPRYRRVWREIRGQCARQASRTGLLRRSFPHDSDRLRFILDNLGGFARTYDRLQDDASRALLLELLRFRVLGRTHVKLSSNTPRYWQLVGSIDRDHRASAPSNPGAIPGGLTRYEVPGVEQPIHLHATPMTILNTFLLEHYVCRRTRTEVAPRPGDVVVDGGACTGDTALWFADRVGHSGRVHAFEFVDANLDVLRRNLTLNPALASRIEVVERALWSRSNQILRFDAEAGAGTSVRADDARASDRGVETLTVDDYVDRAALERIDFIKLDIEGAELDALRGAERTIRRHRPRLAISAYHRESDLVDLPAWLDDLSVGYRFFLTHITIHGEETVLFADPRP